MLVPAAAPGDLPSPPVDDVASSAAIEAGRRVAAAEGLDAARALVLQDSNRLTVHLQPCDVVARIAPPSARSGAEREVAVAQRLAAVGAPIAPLDPRVAPQVHDADGFAVTLWEYCRPVPPADFDAPEYAEALALLHHGMRVAAAIPGLGHVTDRVAEAQGLLDDPANPSPIPPQDRDFVRMTLRDIARAVSTCGAPEQVVHGEPHPGNAIRTDGGLVFVDLETCCRGPVEFDVAHATIVDGAPPTEVARLYPGADVDLVHDCWRLSLALAIAWRFEPGDDLPDGVARARGWVRQLRSHAGGG